MSQDQIWKDLLRAFFEEFLTLFYPDFAKLLDFSRVKFLDKETFTDLPEGAQRRSDLVVEVYTLEGQQRIILVHIEVEEEWRSEFPERMFDYYTLLRWRYRLRIFPIAVYLTSGRGGLVRERYVEQVNEEDVNVFTFNAIGLPALKADDYLSLDNPLAPAVSALMQPSKLGKVAQKFQSLLALVRSGVDEAHLMLLTNVVEKYLKLDDVERVRFEELVATPEGKVVEMVVSIYEERGIEKGIEQGILRGERKTLLRQLERKFAPLPDSVRTRLEAITDAEELDRLTDTILTAETLEDMGL